MYAYCLFCETQKCAYVARMAQRLWNCRALCPKQVQHVRVQGSFEDRVHDLMPGYVFLYAEEPIRNLMPLHPSGVIRVLRYSDERMELAGEDERFALMLLEKDGVIGRTRVYQEGDRIRLTEGAFEGVEANILKVNRRNCRMQIELSFAGRPVRTWVEYEIVSPA